GVPGTIRGTACAHPRRHHELSSSWAISDGRMVTVEDVRCLAIGLPRTTEAVVRRRLKFRVGRIVYLAFSADETVMGFAFPREWRDVLVGSDPAKFSLPSQADLRYNWVHVRLAAIDE